jgi:biopolymer transport protein ExbD
MRFHKTRTTLGETTCEFAMTPMIDIIFQLLIFFVLTFKPITDEGQFGISMSAVPGGAVAMPTVVPGMESEQETENVQFNPPFRVRLLAGPDGQLASGGIIMGERALPSLEYLRFELRRAVGGFAEDFEVIIEADPRLHYQYVVQAVNAIAHSGIRKINFGAPPGAQPPPG